MKRHFIVMYVVYFDNDLSKCSFCELSVNSEDGNYLNREVLIKQIKGISSPLVTHIIITNIIEVSEKDCEKWNLKPMINNDTIRT